jgi:hypothetical protein
LPVGEYGRTDFSNRDRFCSLSFLFGCLVFTLLHHLIVELRLVSGLSGDSAGEEVSDRVSHIDSDELEATIGRPYRGQI